MNVANFVVLIWDYSRISLNSFQMGTSSGDGGCLKYVGQTPIPLRLRLLELL